MTDDSVDKEGGKCLNVASKCQTSAITDVIGSHGPWQFRCWIVFFIASICCSLHLFAIFPLSSRIPCSCTNATESGDSTGAILNLSATLCNSPSHCIISGESSIFYNSANSCSEIFGGSLLSVHGAHYCSHTSLVIWAKCIFVLACFISMLTVNSLSTRFGRRPVCLVSGIILLASSLASSWSFEEVTYLSLRVPVSIGIIIIFLISSSLLKEFVGADYDYVYRLLGHIGWCIARAFIPFLAWLANEWMCFNLVLSSITFILLMSIVFIPESIESYANKELWGHAHRIIRLAANQNGHSTDDIEKFANNFYKPKDTDNEKVKLSMDCKKENLRVYGEIVLQFLIGFTSCFNYFLLLWLTDLYERRRGNYFALLATSEVGAVLILLFALCIFSEKRLWSTSAVLSSLSLLGMYLKSKGGNAPFSTLMFLITMFFSSGAWTLILVWVTHHSSMSRKRNTIIFCIGIGIGGLAASLSDLQKLHGWNSSFLLAPAVLSFVVGITVMIVPDNMCKLF